MISIMDNKVKVILFMLIGALIMNILDRTLLKSYKEEHSECVREINMD